MPSLTSTLSSPLTSRDSMRKLTSTMTRSRTL
jgi:hypothetical protein